MKMFKTSEGHLIRLTMICRIERNEWHDFTDGTPRCNYIVWTADHRGQAITLADYERLLQAMEATTDHHSGSPIYGWAPRGG